MQTCSVTAFLEQKATDPHKEDLKLLFLFDSLAKMLSVQRVLNTLKVLEANQSEYS